MAQKTKIGKNYIRTNANPRCILPMAITRQARELFKPSKHGESLVVYNEKIIKLF